MFFVCAEKSIVIIYRDPGDLFLGWFKRTENSGRVEFTGAVGTRGFSRIGSKLVVNYAADEVICLFFIGGIKDDGPRQSGEIRQFGDGGHV